MKHVTVPSGCYTMKHYNEGTMALTDHDGSPGHPAVGILTECVSHYQAGVCPCGVYLIIWAKEKQ